MHGEGLRCSLGKSAVYEVWYLYIEDFSGAMYEFLLEKKDMTTVRASLKSKTSASKLAHSGSVMRSVRYSVRGFLSVFNSGNVSIARIPAGSPDEIAGIDAADVSD